MSRNFSLRLGLVLVVLASGLLGSAGTSPAQDSSGQLHPLILGWEQFFTLDWQAAQRDGRPVIFGHVYNNWGKAATKMQLLVEGLDATGAVTGQELSWLGSTLTPGMTASFEIPVRAAAPAYRVSVFAFDWLERGRKSP